MLQYSVADCLWLIEHYHGTELGVVAYNIIKYTTTPESFLEEQLV